MYNKYIIDKKLHTLGTGTKMSSGEGNTEVIIRNKLKMEVHNKLQIQ